MALNGRTESLQEQREIDRLTEANQRLKRQLRNQGPQVTEGFFGAEMGHGQGAWGPDVRPRTPVDDEL